MINKKILIGIIFTILILFFAGLYFFGFQKTNTKIILKTPISENLEIKKIPEPQKTNGNALLVGVDKQHCLSKDFIPEGLVDILKFNIPADKSFKLRAIVIPDLQAMIMAAKNNGINLKVISAYRSYYDQQRIYSFWVGQLGSKEASRQSAEAGCSQHQLGTAIDFNELDTSFANTKEGQWLAKNAWNYGWVISYPINSENITGYIYEPWHYRYIGKENAQNFQKSGLILNQFLNEKK